MFSLPHFWLQPFLLLFPLFVHSCLRDKFPRADFGGADYYLRAFLIEWVNRADNGIAAGHWYMFYRTSALTAGDEAVTLFCNEMRACRAEGKTFEISIRFAAVSGDPHGFSISAFCSAAA